MPKLSVTYAHAELLNHDTCGLVLQPGSFLRIFIMYIGGAISMMMVPAYPPVYLTIT